MAAGVIAGALLLLLGAGFGEEASTSEAAVVADAETAEELTDYKKAMEKEIGKLCDAVSGVSGVEVLVSLESGFRRTYAVDHSGDPATVGSGNAEQALLVGIKPPMISGVAIVCHGGNDPTVQQRLTEMISTGLGIASNRVYVTGK